MNCLDDWMKFSLIHILINALEACPVFGKQTGADQDRTTNLLIGDLLYHLATATINILK